ncbi:hypothetical protein [Burkholderia ubonensis]|uniref:hypothetical protein n=1 Tax=Burkholderia ubonensis TaxID=101571 RepID=UPI0012F8404B|nr:hypothetical protein [Burkholderia ubonensis]
MSKLFFKSLLGQRSMANRSPGSESAVKPASERRALSRHSATPELQQDRRSFHHLSTCSANDLAAMQRVCVEAMSALLRIEHS